MSRRCNSFLLTALIGVLVPRLLLAQAPPAEKPVAKAEVKTEASRTLTDPIDRIKDEGLNRSQLMATLSYLTDVIGPRLTGSPNLKRANEWTCQTLTKWGLANAHLEAWGPFGKGWTLKRFSAQVIEPQCIPLIAFPKAWSPSTEGTLVAPVIYFDAKSEAEFAKFKGKVKGAIVLTGPRREVSARFEPLASRKTDNELLELADAAEPTPFRLDRHEGQAGNRAPGGPLAGRPAGGTSAGRAARAGQAAAVAPAAAGSASVRGEIDSARRCGRRWSWPGRKPSSWPTRGPRCWSIAVPRGRRHAVRRPGQRSRRLPGFPMPGRASRAGAASLGLGQGCSQDPAPDRRCQGALQPDGPDDRAGREAEDGRGSLGPVP